MVVMVLDIKLEEKCVVKSQLCSMVACWVSQQRFIYKPLFVQYVTIVPIFRLLSIFHTDYQPHQFTNRKNDNKTAWMMPQYSFMLVVIS